MPFVKPEDWKPSQGILLDEKTLEIIKSNESCAILAGPGAGKTELLAQRAAYLLSTGTCPPPKRILAISFKVDAARNLSERVGQRCEPQLARRFESYTVDGFAKRTVDQFLEALPNSWRPSSDYSIIYLNHNIWDEFRRKNVKVCPGLNRKSDAQLNGIVHQRFPCAEFADAKTTEEKALWLWWRQQFDMVPSRLTFDMIKLMAIQVLYGEPIVRAALQKTYSHVFLDEFQDVTSIQYEALRAGFLGADAVATAVGDSNQAIMSWAGARPDIFDRFEADFGAQDQRLPLNFRSNSRIVNLINDLAATFDPDYIPILCAREDEPVPENLVAGWVFDTREIEGEYIAAFVSEELKKNGHLTPADFVILARLRVDAIEDRISAAFKKRNLKLRNEARSVGGIAIQDLVKERAYGFLLSSIKLAANVRAGRPFQDCRDTVADVKGEDISTDKGHSNVLRKVRSLIDDLRRLMAEKALSDVSGVDLTECIFRHVTAVELQRTYKQYSKGEYLKLVVAGFNAFLDECKEDANTWDNCISKMEGADSVRLMTIHKSKGLEYHTVIFVEVNDDAFWGNRDDANVFFVALSRARERIYFSFTKDAKGIKNTKPFLVQLQKSGVNFSVYNP